MLFSCAVNRALWHNSIYRNIPPVPGKARQKESPPGVLLSPGERIRGTLHAAFLFFVLPFSFVFECSRSPARRGIFPAGRARVMRLNAEKIKKALDITDISVYYASKGVVTMKTNEAVREIMSQQGVGVSALAARIEKTPRLVSDRLSQENISIDKLNEMLRVLDYKIIIAPRSRSVRAGEYEVE